METLQAAPRRAARAARRAAASGSAPAARARSARTASTPKASASASDRRRAQRGQGLGRAQLPQPRRRRRAQHAQHQGRAAAAAPLRARRRARRARPRRHDRGHGAQRRLARPAACSPSGATASRCCCSSTSAARWIRTSKCARSCSRRRRAEFRHLEHFYFHNCVYDHVWRDNARRRNERVSHARAAAHLRSGLEADRRRRRGDEPLRADRHRRQRRIQQPRAGIAWLKRLFEHFRRVVWWNPEPGATWEYTRSTQMILQALGPRMFPLTLAGISAGIDALRH